jgi:hypothetical protein
VQSDPELDALRRAKPYLFGLTDSTSSAHRAPRDEKPRKKTVLEMTPAEYATAKAAMLRECTPSRRR